MVLEFYYDLRSQPARAVYIFMKANNVKFESVHTYLDKGDHMKPEFLKLNPFHKIPIINDNGFVLQESIAIMSYLVCAYSLPEHWFPKSDHKLEARANEFLHWQHMTVRRPCIDVFLNTLRSRLPFGPMPVQPLDVVKVDAAKVDIRRAVTHIADYFLKDKPFILGDKISVVDLIGLMELEQLGAVQEQGLYEDNPVVKAWAERVREALGPHYEEGMVRIREVGKAWASAK